MSDYLWDPADPPDPEVRRLENLLGRLRTTAPPPRITVRLKPDTTSASTGTPAASDPDTPVVSGFSRTDVASRLNRTGGVRYVGIRFLGPALAAAADRRARRRAGLAPRRRPDADDRRVVHGADRGGLDRRGDRRREHPRAAD